MSADQRKTNRNRPSPPDLETYGHLSQRPLTCLAFLAPLLVGHTVGSIVYGLSMRAPQDLERLLDAIGVAGLFLPPLLVVAVLMVQHILGGYPWRVRGKVLMMMAGESITWALPLILFGYVSNWLFESEPVRSAAACLAAMPSADGGWLNQLVRFAGAALYEEFLFRLVLISLILLVFTDLLKVHKKHVLFPAIVAGGVLFALYHYSPAQLTGQESLPWLECIFLAVAGVFWGVLYVTRGFAIAVGSHLAWNVYCLLTG